MLLINLQHSGRGQRVCLAGEHVPDTVENVQNLHRCLGLEALYVSERRISYLGSVAYRGIRLRTLEYTPFLTKRDTAICSSNYSRDEHFNLFPLEYLTREYVQDILLPKIASTSVEPSIVVKAGSFCPWLKVSGCGEACKIAENSPAPFIF